MQQQKHLVVLVTRQSIAYNSCSRQGWRGKKLEKRKNITVNPFNNWKRDGLYILRTGTSQIYIIKKRDYTIGS